MAAIESGADAVECDVRLSSDGYAVCVHDPRLERTSNGTGRVDDHTLERLRFLDWGARHPAGPHGPATLLTLDELVALLLGAGRPVGLLVETKHYGPFGDTLERAVVAAVAPAVGHLPLLAAMSFSPAALVRFARLAPGLRRVRLRQKGLPLPALGRPDTVGLDLVLVRDDPDRVTAIRRGGKGVYVWTVDEPDDVDLCLALGVDAIITNRPGEVAVRVRDKLGS